MAPPYQREFAFRAPEGYCPEAEEAEVAVVIRGPAVLAGRPGASGSIM